MFPSVFCSFRKNHQEVHADLSAQDQLMTFEHRFRGCFPYPKYSKIRIHRNLITRLNSVRIKQGRNSMFRPDGLIFVFLSGTVVS